MSVITDAEYRQERLDKCRDDNAHEFEVHCREVAAQLANDFQEIMCLVEDKAAAWAAAGLLEINFNDSVWDADAREWRRVRRTSDPRAATAHLAACIRDSLQDALNATALEAQEIARDGLQ